MLEPADLTAPDAESQARLELGAETIHQMGHLAEVLDKGWPGVQAWNQAVRNENGETYRQLIARLRKGWGKK